MKAPLFRAAGLLRWPDRVSARLGLLRLPEDVPPEVPEILEATAEAFLRACGTVDLPTWAGLHPAEQAALVVAGNRLRADLASATGWSAQSPDHALAVHGILDGGATAGRLARRTALEAAAREIAQQRATQPVRSPAP